MAANGTTHTNRVDLRDGKSYFIRENTAIANHLIASAQVYRNISGAKEPWTVEAAVAKIPGGAPETNSTSPVPFFHVLERLKTSKREGWRRFGIQQCVLQFLS